MSEGQKCLYPSNSTNEKASVLFRAIGICYIAKADIQKKKKKCKKMCRFYEFAATQSVCLHEIISCSLVYVKSNLH